MIVLLALPAAFRLRKYLLNVGEASDVLLIFLYMVFYVIIPGMVSAIQAVSDTYDRSNSSERKTI